MAISSCNEVPLLLADGLPSRPQVLVHMQKVTFLSLLHEDAVNGLEIDVFANVDQGLLNEFDGTLSPREGE